MNALVTANEAVLGGDTLNEIFIHLGYWSDVNNHNGFDLAIQHLNGFHPPPDSPQEEKLMFSVFMIPDLIPKMKLVQQIYELREQVLMLLYFMNTFHEAMKEVVSDEVYSKIFLSSILLSKFRDEDMALKGSEKFRNVVDFLQQIAVQPTAKEMFQSKRWNTLKKKGKLADEINKPQMLLGDADFNKIREKAIKFGSAFQPQMPRFLRSEIDKEAKRDQVKRDIGSIDTKALQNKLQNALQHKLGGAPASTANDGNDNDDNNEEQEDEKKEENDDTEDLPNDANDDNEVDFSKYRKMLAIGVKLEAVVHEMKNNGLSVPVINQFIAEQGLKKDAAAITATKPAVQPRMPNALMADIANANRNAAPVPAAGGPPPPPFAGGAAAAPLPGAAPIPPPVPAAFVPAAVPTAPHGITNGMISTSILPEGHSNPGLSWNKAIDRFKRARADVRRLKLLTHALDIRLKRERERKENEDDGDVRDDDGNDDEKVDENRSDFHDETFRVYMAQLNRIEHGLRDWLHKSNENAGILARLENLYHSKFRPLIFKEITASRYTALSEAANSMGEKDDEEWFVPDDVIGVIWMFVKPFDELIELKFAVDCINEFFNKDKNKIEVKKLPIQSHRGYEAYVLI